MNIKKMVLYLALIVGLLLSSYNLVMAAPLSTRSNDLDRLSLDTPFILESIIHTIQKTQGLDSITITGHTDESTVGTVDFVTTSAYGSSVTGNNATTLNTVSLTSLAAVTKYPYHILWEDYFSYGAVAYDFTSQLQDIPTIDIWYGTDQAFGSIGQPQPWVNIMGNVSDNDGISSLQYSLNTGPVMDLGVGPDSRRLENIGDFNIDLATADLLTGNNTLVITATDSLGNPNTETITVSYQADNVWPLPYAIDWSSTSPDGNPATPDAAIQSVAQVVDGKWSIDGSVVRTIEPGYDRLINIGDMVWDDYEVTVPITLHGPLPSYYGIGFIAGWNGHTDDPVTCGQPKCGWIPFGAIGWISQDAIRFYDTSPSIYKNISVVPDVTYWLKMRVETGASVAAYSLKVWLDGSEEPVAWDITHTDLTDPVINGSLLLVAHEADVSFGNVSIVPLSGIPNQPPVANSDSAYVIQGGEVDIEVLLNDYDLDGFLDPSTVTIQDYPINGSVLVDETTGTVKYTHENIPSDLDHFTYTVDDNDGETSNEGTVNISIGRAGPDTFLSDDFNSCTLDDSMWTFIDPNFDSSYALVNPFTIDAQLAITVPAGVEHQLWTDGPKVARMMQPAINEDLDLEVKFDSLLTEQYQEQGIVVEGTNGDFLRLEFYSDEGEVIKLFVAVIENYNQIIFSYGATLMGGLPPYMRVTRVGDVWTQYISLDGSSWTANSQFLNYNHPMTVTYVGVYAGNALGIDSPAHTALIDYFQNNASPIEVEDGDLNSITWSTVGQGTIDIAPISANYACNTPVTVTAQEDTNWYFDSWSGDLSGGTNPETLIMDDTKVITATFVNTPSGRIIIAKQTDPDGSSQLFDFAASYTEPFQLADGQTHNSGLIAPGSYNVSENATAGWSLASATCDNGDTPDSIQLLAGDTVTCTFNNEWAYKIFLPIVFK